MCCNPLLVLPPPARAILVALALLAPAAIPAAANAAVSVTGVQLQPSTTAGGAHPDVTINTTFSESPSSDDVKSIHLVLPQGLVGDPNAADKCSQAAFSNDTCPAGAKVGSAEVTAVVTVPPGIDSTQTSPGDLYILEPQGGEPARLGLIVRPPPVGIFTLPKIFLQSGITLGPDTNYGLSTTFDNVPRQDGGLDLRITGTKLTLNGMGAHGPFISNPTNCRPAAMTVSATAYDESGTSTGNASFTPTDCDKLPFTPKLSGTLGGQGLTAKNASPVFTSTISVDPGQANPSAVKVVLPAGLLPDLSQLGRACSPDAFAAGTCPNTAQVGNVLAASPLLPAPLQGPLLLVGSATPGGLPKLGIVLRGAVPITLTGDVSLENGQVVNSFSGLPDLPLGTFQITVTGGHGLLVNLADLCTAGSGKFLGGTITAQSGATSTINTPISVLGCVAGSNAVAKPRTTMSIRFGRSGGVLTAHFKAGNGAPPIARVLMDLPKGLKGVRKGLHLTAAAKVPRKSLHLKGRRLDARLGKAGAVKIALRWRGLKPSAALRKSLRKGSTLPFVVRVKDTGRRTTKLQVLARVALSRK
jgi:hypothetical protein